MARTLEDLEAALRRMNERREETVEKVDLLIQVLKAMRTEDPERMLALGREAGELAGRLGHLRGRAYGIGFMGQGYYLLSNHEAARARFTESVALFREAGDEEGLAMALGGLASVQMSQGDFDQALASGIESLKIFRHTGNREQEAWTLTGFGTAHTDFADYEHALEYHRQALRIFVELGEKVGEGRALTGIGTVYQHLGDYEAALPYHRRSLQLFEEAGNRIGEARALNDLGTVYQHLGDDEAALRFHHESLRIREEIGNRQAQCTSLIHLGALYLRQQDTAKALDVLHRALAVAGEIQARPRIYQAHQILSEVYERSGDLAGALKHHKAFHQVKEALFGEESQAALHNLRIGFEVEKAEQQAEIERLRNVELKEKNEELSRLLDELKAAQARLIQAEKMASLGQLTAGIAHEIKNPLNFVNNFSLLSIELADELAELLAAHRAQPVAEVLADVQDLLDDLKLNARKINEHGHRADGIVRSMLEHSRSRPGRRQPTDLNAMLDEYVHLAYHGLRAEQPDFNAAIACDYDASVGEVDLVPQEMGRVFINLFNNAFYAVREKAASAGVPYAPTVSVSTRRTGEAVEIRVSDNGPGIPPEIRDRIFEPFFTTKPAGSGTGLGLSLSYDIVTQGHGGTLTVESEAGGGTTFVVTLPQAA